MEAIGVVSIIGSIAVVFSFTQDYFRMINSIAKPTATGFVAIQARLIAEEKKFEMWMAYIQVENWTDLENILSSTDLARVKQLWAHLINLLQEARTRLQRIDLNKSKALNRVKWVIGGEFEKLKDVLDAIEAINSVLNLVATPPPGYTPPLSQERFRNRPSPTPVARSRNSNYRTAEAPETTAPARPVRTRQIVAFLYQRATNVLRTIVGQKEANKRMVSDLNALQEWPGTFLEGVMSLDILLEKAEGGVVLYELAKKTLMATLVDILLIEGNSSSRSSCVNAYS
jgi:hypothetical protein